MKTFITIEFEKNKVVVEPEDLHGIGDIAVNSLSMIAIN
jgi:hypothetical protein